MIKDNIKLLNWQNGLLLSAVSYILYIIIWLALDDETAQQLPAMTVTDYMVDFLLCMLFTCTSLGFCYTVFKILPFKASYVRVIVCLMPAGAQQSCGFRDDHHFQPHVGRNRKRTT